MSSSKSPKARVKADDLGINISNCRERSLFQWLICVILFSKPVQQEIAGEAYKVLKDRGYDSPQSLKKAGWQKIVDALGAAHYKRYDESTATRLLDASELLQEEYDGRLRNLIDKCQSATEAKDAVQQFKGIGPKGADIFMREVKPVYF